MESKEEMLKHLFQAINLSNNNYSQPKKTPYKVFVGAGNNANLIIQ